MSTAVYLHNPRIRRDQKTHRPNDIIVNNENEKTYLWKSCCNKKCNVKVSKKRSEIQKRMGMYFLRTWWFPEKEKEKTENSEEKIVNGSITDINKVLEKKPNGTFEVKIQTTRNYAYYMKKLSTKLSNNENPSVKKEETVKSYVEYVKNYVKAGSELDSVTLPSDKSRFPRFGFNVSVTWYCDMANKPPDTEEVAAVSGTRVAISNTVLAEIPTTSTDKEKLFQIEDLQNESLDSEAQLTPLNYIHKKAKAQVESVLKQIKEKFLEQSWIKGVGTTNAVDEPLADTTEKLEEACTELSMASGTCEKTDALMCQVTNPEISHKNAPASVQEAQSVKETATQETDSQKQPETKCETRKSVDFKENVNNVKSVSDVDLEEVLCEEDLSCSPENPLVNNSIPAVTKSVTDKAKDCLCEIPDRLGNEESKKQDSVGVICRLNTESPSNTSAKEIKIKKDEATNTEPTRDVCNRKARFCEYACCSQHTPPSSLNLYDPVTDVTSSNWSRDVDSHETGCDVVSKDTDARSCSCLENMYMSNRRYLRSQAFRNSGILKKVECSTSSNDSNANLNRAHCSRPIINDPETGAEYIPASARKHMNEHVKNCPTQNMCTSCGPNCLNTNQPAQKSVGSTVLKAHSYGGFKGSRTNMPVGCFLKKLRTSSDEVTNNTPNKTSSILINRNVRDTTFKPTKDKTVKKEKDVEEHEKNGTGVRKCTFFANDSDKKRVDENEDNVKNDLKLKSIESKCVQSKNGSTTNDVSTMISSVKSKQSLPERDVTPTTSSIKSRPSLPDRDVTSTAGSIKSGPSFLSSSSSDAHKVSDIDAECECKDCCTCDHPLIGLIDDVRGYLSDKLPFGFLTSFIVPPATYEDSLDESPVKSNDLHFEKTSESSFYMRKFQSETGVMSVYDYRRIETCCSSPPVLVSPQNDKHSSVETIASRKYY